MERLDPGFVATFDGTKDFLCFMSARSGLWRTIPAPSVPWDDLVAADGSLVLFQRRIAEGVRKTVFLVFDPGKGSCEELPAMDGEPLLAGFSMDEASRRYRVVVDGIGRDFLPEGRIGSIDGDGFLYKSEGKAWKRLESSPTFWEKRPNGPACKDGVIWWRLGKEIRSFDVAQEKWCSPPWPGPKWLRAPGCHAEMRVQKQENHGVCIQLANNSSFATQGDSSRNPKGWAIWPHCPLRKGMLSLYPLKIDTGSRAISRFVPEEQKVAGPGFVAAFKCIKNFLCFYSIESETWRRMPAPSPACWDELVAADATLVLLKRNSRGAGLEFVVFNPATCSCLELQACGFLEDEAYITGFWVSDAVDGLPCFSIVCAKHEDSQDAYVYTSQSGSWRKSQAMPELGGCFALAGASSRPGKYSWRLEDDCFELQGLLTFDFATEAWSVLAKSECSVRFQRRSLKNRDWIEAVYAGAGDFGDLKLVLDDDNLDIYILNGDGTQKCAKLASDVWDYEWSGIAGKTVEVILHGVRARRQGSVVCIQVEGQECVAMKDLRAGNGSQWMMWDHCPLEKEMLDLHPLSLDYC
ncbi:hypothetical protein SELMODRAFT_417827 [Selaginella moellendorffii]|uniref:F-box domain-containing protein n=1 Tax=Selaginella moellendorffii TaxID=88036 RepID=D8S3S3_SELML|nr:hypothetical protein SELMODRAFT_417827 [Selaginella moellendorffii]